MADLTGVATAMGEQQPASTSQSQTSIFPTLHEEVETSIRKEGISFIFESRSVSTVVQYIYTPIDGTFTDIEVEVNNSDPITPAEDGGIAVEMGGSVWSPDSEEVERHFISCEQVGDCVEARWQWKLGEELANFFYRFRISGKSLVVEIEGGHGKGTGLSLGRVTGALHPRLKTIPYFNFGDNYPRILCTADYFLSSFVDWHYSRASSLYAPSEAESQRLVQLNGGCSYACQSDGKRSDFQERWLVTVSTQYEEVLPAFSRSMVRRVALGADALNALRTAVARAQESDPFARVVIVVDHLDVAASVRYRLGHQGIINVTVQDSRHLAAELAEQNKDGTRLLTQPLASVAAQLILRQQPIWQRFQPDGQRRLRRSVIDAFRVMEEYSVPATDAEFDIESLHSEYRQLVRQKGYHTSADLADRAVHALDDYWSSGREPAVIYYLPRRLSNPQERLARRLLERGKCEVIIGLTGDEEADTPAHSLAKKLGDNAVVSASANPLSTRAADGTLSIIAAPDPTEEVRSVVRCIAGDTTPFHRIAIVHRQDAPYASLLRQELAFANIPFSGVVHRRLADTQPGRFLLGFIDLQASIGSGIDRERLMEWLFDVLVRQVPAAPQWATLAANAKANGPLSRWKSLLDQHIEQQDAGDRAAQKSIQQDRQIADQLFDFLQRLEKRLRELAKAGSWSNAVHLLNATIQNYQQSIDEDAEITDQITERLNGLAALDDWDITFNAHELRDRIYDALQTLDPVRGEPVGTGVYVGRPDGVAGADYAVLYAVGMSEGQFPPRPRSSPWLRDNDVLLEHDAAQERYDFLAAVAAAKRTVLCWPTTRPYPSRWLIEAAKFHSADVNAANLTANPDSKPWLTYIPSQEDGLLRLAQGSMEPANWADYNLMHLLSSSGNSKVLAAHPAIIGEERMRRALVAWDACNGSTLTEWDGRVSRIDLIGSQTHPISASALETWATCPYKYFLEHILRLSDLPKDDMDEISPIDRGFLVHKILKQFVAKKKSTKQELLALVEEKFALYEERGITGHYLLWEVKKKEIRDKLSRFLEHDQCWLGTADAQSQAGISFGPEGEIGEICVAVNDLAPIWLQGKIDRIDVIANEVLVRGFKTDEPDKYLDKGKGKTSKPKDAYTLTNGYALQPAIYFAAAHVKHPDKSITASYCFPLADKPEHIHDVGQYSAANQPEFHETLAHIIGAVRDGLFPATPDGKDRGSLCRRCDFNRLCPTRRRAIWERKGLADPATQPFNALEGPSALRPPSG